MAGEDRHLARWAGRFRSDRGYRRPDTDSKTRCACCGAEQVRRRTGPHGPECWVCGQPDGMTKPQGVGAGDFVIVLAGLVVGQRSPLDGQLLRRYDPARPSRIDGLPCLATIEGTTNPADALGLADVLAARRCWMRWDGWLRPDANPSRPLTAYTIDVRRRDAV